MELTRSEAARYLLKHDNYCILTHRKPDGDTIGSAAGLCLGLRSIGKKAWVLRNPEFTERFLPLLEGCICEEPEDGALIVAVDVAEDGLLPRAFSHLRNCVDLRIDHHSGNREFCPRSLVDSESAACAEIIWDLYGDLDIEMDEAMANAIYVGTATDTGCFRFANTNAHTFDVAADCTAAGADVYDWNLLLFETNSLARLRLQGWIANNVKLFCDGQMAICGIPKALEEELGVNDDDMGNISSFLRTIEGVKMAALLRENHPDVSRASVRAVPGWDAAAVCSRFGGGGHAGASGATIRLPLQQAMEAMENAMLEWERS